MRILIKYTTLILINFVFVYCDKCILQYLHKTSFIVNTDILSNIFAVFEYCTLCTVVSQFRQIHLQKGFIMYTTKFFVFCKTFSNLKVGCLIIKLLNSSSKGK